MENTRIRSANNNDLLKIQEIARRTIDKRYRSFLGDESVDWYIDSGESDMEIQKYLGNCIVLEKENEIVAFAIFLNDLIHLMMVDDFLHRAGLGTQLLDYVEEQLFSEGNAAIRLETFAGNHQAIDFYTKNGWTVSDQQKDEQFSFIRLCLEKHKSRT